MIIVPPAGRQPNTVLLVGEAPGREEATAKEPFVGKSGLEQEGYLSRHGLTAKMWRRANVVWEYTPGNPDPTVEQIERWTPRLLTEITKTRPKLVVAVGRFATQWFLGSSVDMESVHGLPHRSGTFDPSLTHRGSGATILPVYHPAAGFYDSDARALIDWDYSQVARVLGEIHSGREIDYRGDAWEGREEYVDVTGEELRKRLTDYENSYSPSSYNIIGLDTEGIPSHPWSVQVSLSPGTGLILRRGQEDFNEGIRSLQHIADMGYEIVVHNAMYDIEMCRVMGLDLSESTLFDTMYASYLLRLEPQGLKPLAWRWCGMAMSSYRETVGDVGVSKQLDYLARVVDGKWPKPEPRVVMENDGTSRLYKPQSIKRRASKILDDYNSGKLDKDGNRVDPLDRWKQVDRYLRVDVESELGPMPIGTLDDIPLDRAVWYSGRDPDACVRLYPRLSQELRVRGLEP